MCLKSTEEVPEVDGERPRKTISYDFVFWRGNCLEMYVAIQGLTSQSPPVRDEYDWETFEMIYRV